MQEIYKENILDHFKHPRNFGPLKGAQASAREVNTICGDEVEVQVKIKAGKIADIKFQGQGCAISQAAASILTEEVKGKNLEGVQRLEKNDVLKMLGIPISPARLKCALLALYATKNAIKQTKDK
ncbi:MAG TPA: SUF system NifU family Fe-S cluster assembly protein [Nanoarchaeota archaeon]|nr:MAG: SUF system FeS assembly protein, NifU family [Parcubacteria group bacterium GW2011_GWB1_49_12]HIH18153.1 SUF system NifU family Fe-S cluster assembly protein [Nanoarchaeota archaeon]HIH34130.1 SUF system NifU family Fe-S cluster assembly protein [Nanoarchaeota archaeon]HIH51308.1 SUF system NifU family Fe-S cluster assembly protein [Nanoarchaeota archaeon]HIH65647.1 SUF system NifU family Fe-S cluster assembly protein [Nanoarchaeota archaeon]